MSTGISLVAAEADASLAGLPGGGADAGRGGAPRPLVALAEAEVADGVPAVRWLDRPPRAGDPSAERIIAPAGEGLWRRAPWPAADALFEPAPASDAVVLLAGANAALGAAVAERAAARGVPVEAVERLDAAALSRCACVILADSPGGALPARAPAVLAAGRLLIVPRLRTTFGLQDGLDHLEFSDADEAVTFAEGFRRSPEAFARVALWGRVAARPLRASVAYARLATDLQLLAASGGR